ncbi:hypothetical protein [Shewanella surugensis]|uniref:Transposase n=1 Tax=Shewanella surugensis TaxID=212020 RepID=A0ABT0LG08_9GAMM|nr:hypothetical protein [Shewanella surugensis]MCL1126405.1 hypothetical protein [Shewanella surugensis]
MTGSINSIQSTAITSAYEQPSDLTLKGQNHEQNIHIGLGYLDDLKSKVEGTQSFKQQVTQFFDQLFLRLEDKLLGTNLSGFLSGVETLFTDHEMDGMPFFIKFGEYKSQVSAEGDNDIEKLFTFDINRQADETGQHKVTYTIQYGENERKLTIEKHLPRDIANAYLDAQDAIKTKNEQEAKLTQENERKVALETQVNENYSDFNFSAQDSDGFTDPLSRQRWDNANSAMLQGQQLKQQGLKETIQQTSLAETVPSQPFTLEEQQDLREAKNDISSAKKEFAEMKKSVKQSFESVNQTFLKLMAEWKAKS